MGQSKGLQDLRAEGWREGAQPEEGPDGVGFLCSRGLEVVETAPPCGVGLLIARHRAFPVSTQFFL